MSSRMPEPQTSTDDVMAVEMPFLDAFRRGGAQELHRLQELEVQAEADADAESRPEVEGSTPDELRDSGETGQHGGGSSTPGSAPETADSTAVAAAAEDLDPESDDESTSIEHELAVDEHEGAETESEIPVSLQHTDHQDAVQSASSERGGSGADDTSAVLPQSGFRIGGVQRQPHIKSLPDTIVTVLRRQLQAAAVRELKVTSVEAQEFSDRLSQGTLVTAFLLAQLDLRIDADPATMRAAELFATRDPLLGSVASRLKRIEAHEQDRDRLLAGLKDALAQVRETGAVVEQMLAYSVTDREANFLRGSHNIQQAPFTDREVVAVRDRARELTKKQERVERERDGRPIR